VKGVAQIPGPDFGKSAKTQVLKNMVLQQTQNHVFL
jgi:hypothetical protein